MIDWKQIVTAETVAAEAKAERLAAAKAECRRRIFAVANETAQINLAAVAAAGLLNAGDKAIYATGLAWVAAMRAACATAAVASDATDDALWPAIPPGVAALAARF
jgi:hypothetical protein